MVHQAIPLEVVEERLRSLDAEIQRLTIERELILTWKSRAVPVNTTGPQPSGQHLDLERGWSRHPSGLRAGQTLTDTVRLYVADNPGQTSAEITDAIIASGLVVGGADPRKTLLTTIGNLAAKHRVRRDQATGKFYPISTPEFAV